MAENSILRVSTGGRLLHWVTAAGFLYSFLTGLGIAFPRMNWLLAVMGGGDLSRWLHPWAGALFSVGGILMLLAWGKDMLIGKDDVQWLCGIHHYMCNREEKLPETHKYNAGQKLYFWVTVFGGAVVFFLSGYPMWYPQSFAPGLVRLAIVVHELMFTAAGAFFIVHVYMGSLGMPGTFQALVTGKVTAAWAKAHHPRWYREMIGK